MQHPPGAALLLYNKAPRPSYKAAEGFSCCLLVNFLTAGVSALWQPRRGLLRCTVGEVHNGDLCHGLFDRLQDVLYLLHRVS